MARFHYDGEGRVIGRIDRTGARWTTAYNGMGYKVLEIDGNNRHTAYDIGPFGRVRGKTLSGGDSLHRMGNSVHDETYTLDWLGRQVAVSDNYGKDMTYVYDDAERLRRIDDLTTLKVSDYSYDVHGQRTHETLTIDGVVVREQDFGYNPRGWLSSVDTQVSHSDAGVDLDQAFHIVYHYDQAGNRVQSNGNHYHYDANNRMTVAHDGRNDQAVQSIGYDGFGNRISVSIGADSVSYGYDLNHRLVSSSLNEAWHYDAVGNNTCSVPFSCRIFCQIICRRIC
ncbi:MAG: hypothetical protein KZQ99_22485 [Candidatus Thiodiazotropha sp. (ex Dulcina madagascariensis)]|nr:hypothetical protein [Candidatus Thiodiazotropha sp. (ex Dulcina madagascariensis)]